MGGRITAVCTVAMVLALAGTSRAGRLFGDDWKDGCPPYFDPDARPLRTPTRNDAASMGILPEVDSALGPRRVAVATWTSHFNHDQMSTRWLAGYELVAHMPTKVGPLLTVTYAAADSWWGFDKFEHLGNLQAYVGYRHASLLLGDAMRAGTSVRFGGGSSLFAKSDWHNMEAQQGLDEVNQIAALSPFRTQLYGWDRPLTLSVESRIEMIGCHAAFLHIRLEGTTWQQQRLDQLPTVEMPQPPPTFHRVWAVPLSLAFGGFVVPGLGIAATLGVEFRTPEDLMLFEHITRVGGLAELRLPGRYRPIHVSVHVNAMSGSATGLEAGVAMSVECPVQGARE